MLRWHPRQAARLLVGQSDGAVRVYTVATSRQTLIFGKSKTSKDPVTDAQWDPLSEDYLLVAWQNGSLALYDANSQQEIHSFDIQPQGIRSLAWAKAQPGNFVTATDKIGVLKIWNVSQRSPLSQVKVGSHGVHCVQAFPSDPNLFLIAFKNSSVGVCDIGTRIMKFMSSPGHSETIFDVAFHPLDPDMLATASYDGYVKLWRISTMESQRDMFAGPDHQILYGLAFGPGATRICAVSATGELITWRTDTGEQVLRQQVHNGRCYRCEWMTRHQLDGAGQIATGGADNTACVVDAVTGNIIRKLPHPNHVIGVMWHPSRDGVLATGCQDGNVRIYNFSTPPPGDVHPQLMLQGHSARVFNIAFHPFCPDVIASGSDDKSISIWNCDPQYQAQSRSLRKLLGHKNNVRGLLWHSELPYILFSGSWDATIRVWDVARGVCLHETHEHHADVYGIASHPSRPFFLVSSSRDTTLRYWIVEDIVRPLLVQALLQPARFAELLGSSTDDLMATLSAPADPATNLPKRLYGAASRKLADEIRQIHTGSEGQVSLEVYRKIITFFIYRQGLEDLWGLIATIRGETLHDANTANRLVFHERQLIQSHKSKALELASKKGSVAVGGKQEERLLKAAQIMLRIGDVRTYCRFTAQAGHWERAICIAPAVSRQFWSELCNEYIDTLSASTNIEDTAPFWIAVGKADRLIDTCMERGDIDNALVVAKAEADNLLPEAITPAPPEIRGGARSEEARVKLEGIAAALAMQFAEQGNPLQAALCFLAVSQAQLACSALTRAHETALAYVVADLLGQPKDVCDLKLLALCAERGQFWDAAGELWRQHPRGMSQHLPLMAARCPDESKARAWCEWTREQHQSAYAAALANGDMAGAVLSAVCSSSFAEAADIGVKALHDLIARGGWSVDEAKALMEPLEFLPLDTMSVKDISNILALAAYVGLVEASTLGYHELIFPMAQTLRNIVQHQNLPFPVTMAEVSYMEASSTWQQQPATALRTLTGLLSAPDLPQHLRPSVEQHIAAIQALPPDQKPQATPGMGLARLAGGYMPTCYKRFAKTSVLNNQLIKGPTFELENQQLYVSLPEALGWVRVNLFSPLNTGGKIYPV